MIMILFMAHSLVGLARILNPTRAYSCDVLTRLLINCYVKIMAELTKMGIGTQSVQSCKPKNKTICLTVKLTSGTGRSFVTQE
jgi:hypothetical protein